MLLLWEMGWLFCKLFFVGGCNFALRGVLWSLRLLAMSFGVAKHGEFMAPCCVLGGEAPIWCEFGSVCDGGLGVFWPKLDLWHNNEG